MPPEIPSTMGEHEQLFVALFSLLTSDQNLSFFLEAKDFASLSHKQDTVIVPSYKPANLQWEEGVEQGKH